MKRIEAGTTPPPYPHLQSSETAISPRTEKAPILFTTLLDATRQELIQESVRQMPKKTRFSLGIGLHVAGIASDNGIREEDFRRNFPALSLRRLVGEEQHTGNPFLDAKSKALSAAQIQRNERRSHPIRERFKEHHWWRVNPIVGLDEVNAIPTIQDGQIVFQRVGKPERVHAGREMETVQERFASLARMAQENNWPSVPYIIEMATYIHNSSRRDTSRDAYSVRQMVVLLDPEKLAYLATPEGFAQYQLEAAKTYPPLAKTAGGIKVETFQEMGVIQYMTQNPDELTSQNWTQTNQQKAFQKAHILAAGKLHLGLLQEYIGNMPKTMSERLRRSKRQ